MGIDMKANYANMATDEWPRYFSQYDRESKDETGLVVVHQNIMEEMYQMFKARMISEMTINAFGSVEAIGREQKRLSVK